MKHEYKMFVRYVLADPTQNLTHAYMKAYPNANYETARAAACRLAAKHSVKAALEKGRAKLAEKAEQEDLISREFVLQCMKKALDVNGKTVTCEDGSEKFVSDTSFNKAIEMAAKLHGMLTDKQTVTIEKSFDDILDDIEASEE